MAPRSGCWTCKRRKIGCDRGVPWCGNCIRTGRECLGYNVRLMWPDRHDGRRKEGHLVCHVVAPAELTTLARAQGDYGQHFLNVTSDDVLVAKDAGAHLAVLMGRPAPRPARALTLHPALAQQDGVFMRYYENVISPMVSTVHIKNGFRTELLPMALCRSDASSAALCSAMLAVSAFHHNGPEAALPYKVDAVRHLSESLAAGPGGSDVLETQVAASMMLCVHSVFDETEGNWHMHLDGAKNMLRKLCANDVRPRQSDFLFTWFLYHEVLGCFTQPFREVNDGFDILWLLQGNGSDNTHIVGSLGCSAEILEIIHRINRLRASSIRVDTYAISQSLVDDRTDLDYRLQSLTQTLNADDEAHEPPFRRSRILATAELYRLAALLYLQRVCPQPSDDALRPAYLEQAFAVLGALEVATSPWPLFIVACESAADQQRLVVLRTLDRMDDVRKIGNVHVMRTIIEAFWKQFDFRADAAPGGQMRWWDMVNCDTAVPWFI